MNQACSRDPYSEAKINYMHACICNLPFLRSLSKASKYFLEAWVFCEVFLCTVFPLCLNKMVVFLTEFNRVKLQASTSQLLYRDLIFSPSLEPSKYKTYNLFHNQKFITYPQNV